MAIFPRHKAFLEQFIGEVVGVEPFIDPGGGNMALFRTRAAAEELAKLDPFYLEGAVKEYRSRSGEIICYPSKYIPLFKLLRQKPQINNVKRREG